MSQCVQLYAEFTVLQFDITKRSRWVILTTLVFRLFLKILASVPWDVVEVEFQKDGSWTHKKSSSQTSEKNEVDKENFCNLLGMLLYKHNFEKEIIVFTGLVVDSENPIWT